MQLSVDRGTDRLAVNVFDRSDAETIIVIFPAMGVPAGYYTRFATALNDAGLSVAVADLRGNGESRPKPSKSSSYGYRQIADDVAAVLQALAPYQERKRTILLGHSLGGQAAMMHLSGSHAGVDGLILIAVGLPYWRTYGRQSLGVLGFLHGVNVVSAMLGYWPGWGFGGRQARRVMRDWAHTGRTGTFPPHLGVEDRLSGVTVPVLAISVDADQYTPARTMDFTIAKLSSAPVRREHLTSEAAGVALDHFKWVKAGEPLAKLIVDWLRAQDLRE
ncbi:alpha/beta hydrolase family protein [Allorhizocola rhizosphaerae]|uniref:alpha/beta hydrolase family protein n=1 Tax=Allorhizocola rhizosphaerae TaxID=1872709 RepID=UPI000E3E040C|nr:alpha/beta fold hydrolase [Allorhizocola rhizosphaerae]